MRETIFFFTLYRMENIIFFDESQVLFAKKGRNYGIMLWLFEYFGYFFAFHTFVFNFL